MKTQFPSTRAKGFTLIEMLVTVTIIIILMGIVVGGIGFVQQKQARSLASVQIKLLESAIEEYKLDLGVFPGTELKDSSGNPTGKYYGGGSASGGGGLNSIVLHTALYEEGAEYSTNQSRLDPDKIKANKIYVPGLDPTTTKQGWIEGTGSSLRIVDPWGSEYLYRMPGTVNPDFDIVSKGKDGIEDTGASGDDIRN